MEKEPLYCAIDISKATLDVDAAALALPEQLGNDKAGYRQLIKAAKKYPGPVHFVFEASGPYHLGLALALWEAELALSVLNPVPSHVAYGSFFTIIATDLLGGSIGAGHGFVS